MRSREFISLSGMIAFYLLPQAQNCFPHQLLFIGHISLCLAASDFTLSTILLKGAGISLTALLALGLCWIAYITASQQRLALLHLPDASRTRNFLGRVLLFPARLNHFRFFPKRLDFHYDYFLVGIPIGLRGNLGSVLSIDTDGAPGEKNRGLLKECWFNVDQKYYLEPGLHPQGLEGKLHALLREKGENPTKWPYAYLVSTPRFLWSTRNIVSWWFLYNAKKELDALVFEVNNSFWERKIILMHLGQGAGRIHPKNAEQQPNHAELPVDFLHSTSPHKLYKSGWQKDLFVSPFQKVDGSYGISVRDPCLAGLNGSDAFHSAVTLFTPAGNEEIATIKGVVNSCGEPLDPLVASGPTFAWFLVRWAYVSTLSISRIHLQALRAFMTGTLTYYQRPEVRTINICREATEIERSFESYFRLFLDHITFYSAQPVKVDYKPSKSAHFSPETYQSCAGEKQQLLTLQVRSPILYTEILQHTDASIGLALEATPKPLSAERDSCSLEISDLDLLQRMLRQEREFKQRTPRGIGKRMRHCALNLSITVLRGTKSSFMDQFVYANLADVKQHQYQVTQIHYWLHRRFSIMGSSWMLSTYKIVGQIILMRVILAWICRNPVIQAHVDNGTLIGYTGGYLLLHALVVLRKYILEG